MNPSRPTGSPPSGMGHPAATNALLERRGEPTVLLITEGFRDALRSASPNPPRLFDRHIALPETVHERVIEVPERIDAHRRTGRPLSSTPYANDCAPPMPKGCVPPP
ncbi:hypothetical protein SBADM41S_11726 [Streptomyces badius]